MSSPPEPLRPPPSVFLSYASEDRPAAQAIRDALPGYGIEVWYDESALTGGDAWDQKIRRQIRECDFFMPVISAQTEARSEGYFRREWRLAVERTLDMADDHTFLLPVVIDDTTQLGARVPEKFLGVQWLRLPGGQPTAALEALCRRLVSGQTVGMQAPKKAAAAAPADPDAASSPARTGNYPPFPREEAGQKIRFWAHVVGWTFQSAWTFFTRFPRWVRILIYVWLGVVLLSRGCMPAHEHSARISSADAEKIKEIAQNYQGASDKADVAKLGTQIARVFSNEAGGKSAPRSAMLAIPFSTPSGDPAAQKLANASFAQMYGKVAVSQDGRIGMTDEPLSSIDPSVPADQAALEQGRTQHSKYVIYGAVDSRTAPESLVVKIVRVADASVLWSQSYPVAAADPANIATDVDSKLQSLEDE
jgi:hypothetical protein